MSFLIKIFKELCPPIIYKIISRIYLRIYKSHYKTNEIKHINDDAFKLYAKSFGDKNPDKNFYVIRGFGAGMFSNLQYVLANLRQAELLNMIPVVDFENFNTIYNEPYPVNNTNNAWEYFFSQTSGYSLKDVYQSKNVFFNTGKYNWDMGYYFSDKDLFFYYKKYIKFNPDIIKEYNDYKEKLFGNKRILGVHFRGWEMNTAPGHPFCPTEKQMIKLIDMILDKYSIDSIFLVTEQQEYYESLTKKYGNKILTTPYYRTKQKIDGYYISPEPRKNHLYLLGKDIIRDALLLSDCIGLLHCNTNVSTFSRFINQGKYEFEYSIDNGINSDDPFVAKYLYNIKKRLPSKLGGLKGEIHFIERK